MYDDYYWFEVGTLVPMRDANEISGWIIGAIPVKQLGDNLTPVAVVVELYDKASELLVVPNAFKASEFPVGVDPRTGAPQFNIQMRWLGQVVLSLHALGYVRSMADDSPLAGLIRQQMTKIITPNPSGLIVP
jgi:hypothetical protein